MYHVSCLSFIYFRLLKGSLTLNLLDIRGCLHVKLWDLGELPCENVTELYLSRAQCQHNYRPGWVATTVEKVSLYRRNLESPARVNVLNRPLCHTLYFFLLKTIPFLQLSSVFVNTAQFRTHLAVYKCCKVDHYVNHFALLHVGSLREGSLTWTC